MSKTELHPDLHPLFDTPSRLNEAKESLGDYPSLEHYLATRPVPAL